MTTKILQNSVRNKKTQIQPRNILCNYVIKKNITLFVMNSAEFRLACINIKIINGRHRRAHRVCSVKKKIILNNSH